MENISTKALNFATLKHHGQIRKTGEEYITHPVRVSKLVQHFKSSKNIEELDAASTLHDTLEDTNTTYYELVKIFGYLVANLVLELTTNEDMKNEIGKKKYLAYKLKSMTSWALVIKLCDRLDNVSDLDIMCEEFRTKYIEETLYIISYITNNKKLSNTHIRIINEILKTINNTRIKKRTLIA
jgi:(p)ppGpp synthase/HD superfamily hydrolase